MWICPQYSDSNTRKVHPPLRLPPCICLGAFQETASSLTLYSRAKKVGISPSPAWKLNHSRLKSSWNWEAYTGRNLETYPIRQLKLESSPQGLHLSLTLSSLISNSPISTWLSSSGDQELSLSLGDDVLLGQLQLEKSLPCIGSKAIFLRFKHTISFCPLGMWRTNMFPHSRYAMGDNYDAPVSLLAYRPDIFISFSHFSQDTAITFQPISVTLHWMCFSWQVSLIVHCKKGSLFAAILSSPSLSLILLLPGLETDQILGPHPQAFP